MYDFHPATVVNYIAPARDAASAPAVAYMWSAPVRYAAPAPVDDYNASAPEHTLCVPSPALVFETFALSFAACFAIVPSVVEYIAAALAWYTVPVRLQPSCALCCRPHKIGVQAYQNGWELGIFSRCCVRVCSSPAGAERPVVVERLAKTGPGQLCSATDQRLHWRSSERLKHSPFTCAIVHRRLGTRIGSNPRSLPCILPGCAHNAQTHLDPVPDASTAACFDQTAAVSGNCRPSRAASPPNIGG